MSDRAKGAQRVRSVETKFHQSGFRTAIVSASGQRRGARHESLALDGDLVALAPAGSMLPHFICEIGGVKKSVRASLIEMNQHPLPPGFTAIVVRLIDPQRRRWRWHVDSAVAYGSLAELLDGVR